MDYIGAIKKSFSDWKKLLIGCLLNIIPIINLFSIGYTLECAKSELKNKRELPAWEKWGELFVNGLLMIIISVIYMIPTIILMAIALISGIEAGIATEDIVQGILAGSPFFIVGFIIGVIMLYVIPMAIINFVKESKFKAAFQLKLIFKKILTKKYLFAWLIIFGINVIVSAILTPLSNLNTSIPNYLASRILSFIVSLIGMIIYAQAYSETK